MSQLSVVIPTLGRPGTLRRVLDRLEHQTSGPASFDVAVVADPDDEELQAIDAAVEDRPYQVRRLLRERAGASSARNAGWRAAQAPVVLFLDDDVLPEPALVAEHLDWHARHPAREVGVLGHVRWADELPVTAFRRWLDRGIQFEYGTIEGQEAGWGRFYTANASVKRELLELVGGFDEERLPFYFEDTDLALRMHARGFRLLYNPRARAEHLNDATPESWRARLPEIARAERRFCELHPEVPPHFLPRFETAAAAPPARGRAARLARFVGPDVPWLGPRVWAAADLYFRQLGAPTFLAAWSGEENAGIGAAER